MWRLDGIFSSASRLASYFVAQLHYIIIVVVAEGADRKREYMSDCTICEAIVQVKQ
jgi:hypothetical protein